MAKRTPPRPKSTANLPAGLKAYWAKKGVGSSASTAKKSTAKRKTTKRKKTAKKK